MKLIYLTDTHFDSKGPASRADNYYNTCMLKLIEVLEYAKANHISTILHGGDFFDSPKPGYSTLVPFMDALAHHPDIRWYINVGNHDLYGWAPSTYPRSALKVLSYIPNITILDDRAVTSIAQYVRVYSVWSKFDREGDPNVFALPKEILAQLPGIYIIVMAHTLLVEKTFVSAHVPMGSVPLDLTGDLILGSHYHPGWRMRKDRSASGKEVQFAHPAALLRTVKSDPKYCYAPAFIVIEIVEGKLIGLELVPLKCAVVYPFKEEAVAIPEEKLPYAPKFDAFMEELMTTAVGTDSLDPRVLASRIAHDQGFPEAVLSRVITNLDAAKKEQ